MKVTIEKLKGFQAMVEDHKRALRPRLDQAHVSFNNQYSTELRAISEYNFWMGYEYALFKIIQYMKLKPPSESNPQYKI